MPDACCNPGVLFVDGQATGLRVRVARSFLQRGIGLLGSRGHADFDALLLRRCAAVHTLGMSRRIDVCFVSAAGRVLQAHPHLAPWGFAACSAARDTWEMAPGSFERLGIRAGTTLSLGPQAMGAQAMGAPA